MSTIEIAVAAVCRASRPEYIGGTEDADQGSSIAVRDPDGIRYRTKRLAIQAHGIGMEALERLLRDPNSGWTAVSDD